MDLAGRAVGPAPPGRRRRLRRRIPPPRAARTEPRERRCRRRQSGWLRSSYPFVQLFLGPAFVKGGIGISPYLHVVRWPTSRDPRARPMSAGHEHGDARAGHRFPVRTNHKPCMKCGKLVSRAAFACRRCGKRQRIRPRTMLLVAVGLPAGRDVRGRERERAADAAARPETAPAWPKMAAAPAMPKAAAEVTASELWAAYARDRARGRSPVPRQVGGRDAASCARSSATTRAAWSRGCRPAMRSRPSTRSSRRATIPTIVGVTKGRSVSLLCVGRGALMGAPQLGGCFVR